MQSQHKHLFTKVLQASNWFAEKRHKIALQKEHHNHQLKYYIYESLNYYTSRSSHFQIQDYVKERLSERRKALMDLDMGDCMVIQNQTGNYPLRWDKTGIIVEVKGYNQ